MNVILPGVTMLIVEDDADMREMIRMVIARHYPGTTLHIAENGVAGLELFKAKKPGVVLTDVSMPIMDGLVMATEIRALNEAVPIVFLTAYNDSQFLQKANSIGTIRYVMKPIDYQKLFKAIDDCLADIMLEQV